MLHLKSYMGDSLVARGEESACQFRIHNNNNNK